MTHVYEYDLFQFLSEQNNKGIKNVIYHSNKEHNFILKFSKAFFQDDISTNISPTSILHDIFCTNTQPNYICMAKENIQSDYARKEMISNIHSFFTEVTNVYDPSSTIYEVLSVTNYSLFTFFQMSKKKQHTWLDIIYMWSYIRFTYYFYFC